MDLQVKFANPQQQEFYYSTARNQLFSGGFNNGKSYAGCLKAVTLLFTFPGYRFIIARQTRADLMKTTYQTFFKICPRSMIESQNLQEGYTIFRNGSRVDWLHLNAVEESTLRGFEVNSVLTDQAEECAEATYDILDARIGRWDDVTIPAALLEANPQWPINDLTGRFVAPSYHINLCNPDTEFHHLYRHYHPDSETRDSSNFFIEGEWDPNLGSRESYQKALKRDEEWTDKYVRGKWGRSGAQIHHVSSLSYLTWTPELFERIRKRGNLFRVLDHGESSPTCCLWVAALDGVYIVYREYYAPNQVISEHRRAIEELSGDEKYSGNYADPSIFDKWSQKKGGFWTVADEYLTRDLPGAPIAWIAADNNEFATRNRLNELLRFSDTHKHPVSGEDRSPGIYFIRRSDEYPYGCQHAISEVGAQRRALIGYFEGKALYSDEREKSVKDHAYDCVRYFVSMHGSPLVLPASKAPRFSMAYYKQVLKTRKYRASQSMSMSS